MFRLLFFLPILLFSNEIELFCDYDCEAKGQEMFPLYEEKSQDELPLGSLLRRKLIERGDDLRSWELDRYLATLENASTKTTWMFWNLGPKLANLDFSKVPKEKLVLVMWEPPTVQEMLYDPNIQKHFGKIFTWDDDLVDQKKFFKFHYPALRTRIKNIPSFEEKKFSVMIARRLTSKYPKELYSERKSVIKFFEKRPKGEFDLYGHRWKKKYKNYKGSCSDKLETLKEYKFSFAYENTKDMKGYITEKIFDCFAAGVVPIYLGASNVTDYIPKKCFIDRRDFSSNKELLKYLKKMSKEEYQEYLDHAEAFLKSDKAKVFTNRYFVENILSKI